MEDDYLYGLDKVKKRLPEYLAVLRLKQSVNDDLDAWFKKIEEELEIGASNQTVEGTADPPCKQFSSNVKP